MRSPQRKYVFLISICCMAMFILCGCNQNSKLNGTFMNEETGFSMTFDGKDTCSIANLQNYCFEQVDGALYLKLSNLNNTANYYYTVKSEGNTTYSLTNDSFTIFGIKPSMKFRFTYQSGTDGLAILAPQFDGTYKYTDYEDSRLEFYGNGTVNVTYDRTYKKDGGLLYLDDVAYANKYDEATQTFSIKTILGWEDLVKVN